MKSSCGLVALAACLVTGPVAADPRLLKSTPADGSTLSAAPSVLELTFSDPVQITELTIYKDHAVGTSRKCGKTRGASYGRRSTVPTLCNRAYCC